MLQSLDKDSSLVQQKDIATTTTTSPRALYRLGSRSALAHTTTTKEAPSPPETSALWQGVSVRASHDTRRQSRWIARCSSHHCVGVHGPPSGGCHCLARRTTGPIRMGRIRFLLTTHGRRPIALVGGRSPRIVAGLGFYAPGIGPMVQSRHCCPRPTSQNGGNLGFVAPPSSLGTDPQGCGAFVATTQTTSRTTTTQAMAVRRPWSCCFFAYQVLVGFLVVQQHRFHLVHPDRHDLGGGGGPGSAGCGIFKNKHHHQHSRCCCWWSSQTLGRGFMLTTNDLQYVFSLTQSEVSKTLLFFVPYHPTHTHRSQRRRQQHVCWIPPPPPFAQTIQFPLRYRATRSGTLSCIIIIALCSIHIDKARMGPFYLPRHVVRKEGRCRRIVPSTVRSNRWIDPSGRERKRLLHIDWSRRVA